MKVKIELFGAARDFGKQNMLEFELEQKSTIKDIRKKIIQYLDEKFNGNENYKKIVNSSAFCLSITFNFWKPLFSKEEIVLFILLLYFK